MTTGEYKITLDEKGRIMLPSKVRSHIADGSLILTQRVDRCLWLFTIGEWDRVTANLMESTSLFQSRARLIQRRIIAPAQDVEIDKSGRITISPALREYSMLDKECVLLAINSYFEVWDESQYKSYWDDNEAEFQKAAEELGKILTV